MYLHCSLDQCDLGAMTARGFIRPAPRAAKPAGKKFRAAVKGPRPPKTLYGMRSLQGLAGYDDDSFDGGLGKSFFKKVAAAVSAPVKAVEKAVVQVAKVAVAPAAIVAAASLDAVGLRNAASKVIDNTALNKSIAQTEKGVAKVAGTAIDVGAAVVAAPLIASSAGAAGTAIAGAAKTVVGSKLIAPILGLFAKKPTSGQAATEAEIVQEIAPAAPSQAQAQIANLLKTAAQKAGQSVVKTAQTKILGGVVSTAAPAADQITPYADASSQAAQAAQAGASYAATPDGTAPAATQASAFDLGAIMSNPKALIFGAAVSLFLLLPKRGGRSRR